MDPDEVFQQHKKTCSLDEVFTKPGERSACAQLMMRGMCECRSTQLKRSDGTTPV